MQTLENAKWIADKGYICEKNKSPVPSVFKRVLSLHGEISCAEIHCTAMGIYDICIDGSRVSENYFAPGFTSYKHFLQYQTYDVTKLLKNDSTISVTVAGGWAVGSFNYNRRSRIANDRCSLLFALEITYKDGKKEQIVSDKKWLVSEGGPLRFAEWYDGEIFDANICEKDIKYKCADEVKIRYNPQMLPQYGLPVRVWNTLKPVSVTKNNGNKLIYDFGQNFAGVISFKVNGKKGQKITFVHAEAVKKDGELNTAPLRTAKQTLIYTCKDGLQEYSPRFTYMGFRYLSVEGVEQTDIEIIGIALCSNLQETGTFECSNADLNKLNENMRWSARSNFIDIPTDCPQRDERLGWTGDISIFARTACYNYDMSVFLKKWLKDVSAEQTKFGSIPMVVPRNGDKFPPFTTAVWGECCILVPWAEYLARGDVKILQDNYSMMKRFAASTKRWAGLFALGKRRYIWKWLFQFGDWCSPVGSVIDWLKTGKWIATAYWANSCDILAKTATLLGYKQDAEKYAKWRSKIISAYREVFTNGKGKLKKEFQTAYVLPLYFNMVRGEEAKSYAQNLARLVKENGNHLTTGFTSTPYILFALADNGQKDVAFDLLLQDTYPSWLYAVKSGATTIWERYDLVDEEGNPNPDGSMNHYAFGAVCDFFYRRILGIEAIEGGYRAFQIKPVMGGDISWAKGKVKTPYGEIAVDWQMNDGAFEINLTVPQDTVCTLTLPSGKTQSLVSGSYTFKEQL